MDSDDEAFQEQIDQHVRNNERYAIKKAFEFGDHINLKLYQKEECEILRLMHHRHGGEPLIEIDWTKDLSSVHRFERFVDSFVGFHKGSLDLTGRHEYRYKRLAARWMKFVPDVVNVFKHAKLVRIPMIMRDGSPFIDLDGNHVIVSDHIVDPPEIRERFDREWRIGAMKLQHIVEHTRDAMVYVADHPIPIFQKLLLQDLPPEIIHEIMQMAEQKDARRMGSTSKYFREIALSYVYHVRWCPTGIFPDHAHIRFMQLWTFDMPFKLGETYESKSPEEQIAYIQVQARNGYRALMEEIDFVLTRPGILNSIHILGLLGMQYGLARDMLDLDVGSQEYTDLFGRIESRVTLVLERTPNVESLNLTNLCLSPDMLQAIAAAHKLRGLVISSSQMTKSPNPLQFSFINITLFFSSPETLSLWSLVESCPNLRFLHIYPSDEVTIIEPDAEIRERYNPFMSLERLILTRFEHLDILFFVQWMREAPNLRLTHFWIEGGGSGIFPLHTVNLLLALHAAPLQVLILDGLHQVEPSLLEQIAALFPYLRGLTLFYRDSSRQTRTRPVVRWPHASWEYAPYFRGFHRLEFFCWNFEVHIMERAFHQTLQLFEEDFPRDSWELEDEESLADWNSVARVLAVYCPTLKYVLFNACPECVISRTPSGDVVVTGGEREPGRKWGRQHMPNEYLPLWESDWEFVG